MNLTLYARACQRMYDTARFPPNWTIKDIDHHRVAHFRTRRHQVLVVRGSADLRHVRTNLNARVVPVIAGDRSETHVHAGYWEASQLVWNHLEDAFDLDEPLLFLGHSMGGAVVSLLARTLAGRARDLTVVAFGSPGYLRAPCASDLALESRPHVLHVVSERDPVCRIPFHLQHHGRLYNLDRHLLLTKSRYPEGRRLRLSDHAIETYLQKLRNNPHLVQRNRRPLV